MNVLRLLDRRALLVIASLAAVTLAFHFANNAVAHFSGLFGAVPIVIAAWFFGPRVALAVAASEGVANFGLLGHGTLSSEELATEIVEGAAVAIVAITAGATQQARRRLAIALATDPVTGLATRQAFAHETDRLLALGTNVTIGMLDLIDLGDVNEAFGYDVGDELLRAVAARLRDTFGASTFIAKGNTDRFAALWPAVDPNDELLAQRLLAVVDAPFVIGGAELRPRARASVTRRDTVGAGRANELIRAGNVAVEHASRHGRSWRSAEPAARTDGVGRLDLLSDLGHAVARGELRLHYQPIVDLTTGSLQGVEALVRWQHPARGLIPPLEFIPLAEQSGLIVPLTEWVIGEALRQSHQWSEQRRRLRIAVNVGAKTLVHSVGLAAMIERFLRKHDVDPVDLCVEVTESDVMTDSEQAATILTELKALGVHVEIDDFGTGYSSLAYLQKLPVDGVKIDRSLISPLLRDDNSAAIVRAAIDLSHALGLDTVAEGVEDEPALQRLKDMGCDAVQGYVIARPMRGAEVLSWADDFERRPAIVKPSRPVVVEPAVAPVVLAAQGTVLVVDDEHPFRLAAHRILSAQGYRVLHAATASEALRICTELGGKIDLLLTDIYLSDWRGNDLAAHVRRTYPDIRILYMSGDAEGKERAGADAFLAKPFSNRDLVEHVAGALLS